MGQVPRYLLIGNGRVATHLQHYFSLLNLSFTTWHRNLPLIQLHEHLKEATHVLLLITDHAIDDFYIQHLQRHQGFYIHFSGSKVSSYVNGAHPLMTFSKHLYGLSQYQSIPFVVDHNAPSFAALLPGLSNPHVRLNTALKAKYHALCVLSGNFSCMLWQKLFNHLVNEFNIPAEIAHPYLLQQMQNLLREPENALTGPLVRGDRATVQMNLEALQNDPFQNVYQSFISCYQQMKES